MSGSFLAGNRVQNLVAALGKARVYDLEQPRYFGAPTHPSHVPGFVYALHRRHEQGLGESRTGASGLILMPDHSGTHLDALCHQAEDLHLYGGRAVDARLQGPTGFNELGVETVAPLLARGLLLDAARHAGVVRIQSLQALGAGDLEAIAAAEGVSIEEGDVVLVRTGYGALWHDPAAYMLAAGVAGDASHWLAGRRVKAVGADNMAWDVIGPVDPATGTTLPGHILLLVRSGIYILENLFLEELARDACYEFVFVCLPLKMRGATGSPVRPLAIVPD